MASYSEDSGFVKTVAQKRNHRVLVIVNPRGTAACANVKHCGYMAILTQKRAEVHAFRKTSARSVEVSLHDFL